jgi:hypothetical protein
MAMGIAAKIFILRLSGRRRSLVLVIVRRAAVPRIIIGMMMGVPRTPLVRMLHFHHDTRSQNVNERDHNDQKTLEDASHF